MGLSTAQEDAKVRIQKEVAKLEKIRELQPTTIPTGDANKDQDEVMNPFLDISLRELIDDFVMTWHKIIMELLDFKNYDHLKRQNEWWDIFVAALLLLRKIFWVQDRLFHIGVGLVIMSFFVFFICVSQS